MLAAALVFLVVHLTGTGSDKPLPAVPRVTEPVADQWELYHLDTDPTEQHNLLVYDGAFPTVVAELP